MSRYKLKLFERFSAISVFSFSPQEYLCFFRLKKFLNGYMCIVLPVG